MGGEKFLFPNLWRSTSVYFGLRVQRGFYIAPGNSHFTQTMPEGSSHLSPSKWVTAPCVRSLLSFKWIQNAYSRHIFTFLQLILRINTVKAQMLK